MKAIVQRGYGPPDEVLRLRQIDRPEPGAGEVLVRVRATSIHPDIWHAVTGRPFVLRLMGSGLRRPKNPVPGMDVAGLVEAVGARVTKFKPGDGVFGLTHDTIQWCNGGTFAEYVTAPQDALVLKPPSVGFAEAASVPTSGFIALHNLRGSGKLEPGRRLLINGAGGGVGTIAVQLGKAHGAHVTAVDGPDKMELLRRLGADHVVDYTREDFTRGEARFDLILDIASNLSFRDCRRVLTRKGVYVIIGHDHYGRAKGPLMGSIPRILGLVVLARFVDHLPRAGPPTPGLAETLALLAGLLEAGKLTPVIDRTYPLEEAAEAMDHLTAGTARGKIILTP